MRVPRCRATEEVYSTKERKIKIKLHRLTLQGHVAPLKKNRERQDPSQGVIQKCEPQERNPRASKIEDRTLQEALQQERCARRDAWGLAINVFKLKTKDKATLDSSTEAWVMPAPSAKKPEEREFEVGSGASRCTC